MEFDAVVVLDAAALAKGPTGERSIYVALTRATQHVVLCAAASAPSWLHEALADG